MQHHNFKFQFKKSKKHNTYPSIKLNGKERVNIDLIPGSKYKKNNEEYGAILRIKGNQEGLIALAKSILIIALLEEEEGYHINIDAGSGMLDDKSLDTIIEYQRKKEETKMKLSKSFEKFKSDKRKSLEKISKDFFKNTIKEKKEIKSWKNNQP
jgi:hypothetical protein